METSHTDQSGGTVELEFEVPDRDLFFVDASATTGAEISLAELFPRADGRLLEYFTVEGVPPGRVDAAARDAAAVDETRLVRSVDGGSLFEFVVSGPCIGGTLADVGAVIRELSASDGVGRVVADVPPHVDVRDVVETVAERHHATLKAQRGRDRPGPEFTPQAFRETLQDHLTDRQLETLRTALSEGYYRWPRETTAEECAARLNISQPTFTQHLRVAEQKIFESLFEETERRERPAVPR